MVAKDRGGTFDGQSSRHVRGKCIVDWSKDRETTLGQRFQLLRPARGVQSFLERRQIVGRSRGGRETESLGQLWRRRQDLLLAIDQIRQRRDSARGSYEW